MKKLPEWLSEYRRANYNYVRANYPNLPEKAIPTPAKPKDTANEITKAIIKYCTWRGWQAERVNVTGRWIFNKRANRQLWIPTSGTRGSADIHATIAGMSVKIEVKAGKDRLSDYQKDYARRVIEAGGHYLVVHSFEDFYNWLKNKNLLP